VFFTPRRGKLSGAAAAAVQELRWRFWGKQRFSSCKLKSNLHTFASKFKLKSKKVREVERWCVVVHVFPWNFWRWVFLSGVENVDVCMYWTWYRVISRNIYWGLANLHAQVLHTIVSRHTYAIELKMTWERIMQWEATQNLFWVLENFHAEILK
jgi:hypothetical protein